jgi:hypothetical protein
VVCEALLERTSNLSLHLLISLKSQGSVSSFKFIKVPTRDFTTIIQVGSNAEDLVFDFAIHPSCILKLVCSNFAIGYPVALDAKAEERDTRVDFNRYDIFSSGETANCTLQPPAKVSDTAHH